MRLRKAIFYIVLVAALALAAGFLLASREEIPKEESGELYYLYAKTKVEELTGLAEKDDIESIRRYMEISDKYLEEALHFLDEASRLSKSDSLKLDIELLRFRVFREGYQRERRDILEDMASAIFNASEDPAVRESELNRISEEFGKMGMGEHLFKFRMLYAAEYGGKESIGTIEEIRKKADGYFAEENFSKAIEHYRLCLEFYEDYPQSDYCALQIAESFRLNGNTEEATLHLNDFLAKFPGSGYFDAAFVKLGRLYFEEPSPEKAAAALRIMAENFPEKEMRHYARLLMGALYYSEADYENAVFNLSYIKDSKSPGAYFYAADTLLKDIKKIENGGKPGFSYGGTETYRIWEPGEGNKDVSLSPSSQLEVAPGGQVEFSLKGLSDTDRFAEFLYDSEDVSRLPRKIGEKLEHDLILLRWKGPEAGHFPDEKNTVVKKWTAPLEPGKYKVYVFIEDLGLVRPPDEGARKDDVPIELVAEVTVR